MIEIGVISLRLPSALATRAANIAHELSAALGSLDTLGPLKLERVGAAAARVDFAASDVDIARALADAVLRGVQRTRGETW